MIKDTVSFEASDGLKLALHRWISKKKPKGVILISHGMMEFAMRYDSFAQEAVKKGYAVYAPDQRAHGETAGAFNKLGFVPGNKGFDRFVADMEEITTLIEKNHPLTPIILLGHSFGSFVAQMCVQQFGNRLSGCVLSGTRGPNPLLDVFAKPLALLVGFSIGWNTPSRFLNSLVFDPYAKQIQNAKTPNDWLSRDEKEVEAYTASPWCGFPCSAGFYLGIADGLSRIFKQKSIMMVPSGFPILLISGGSDPSGGNGTLVRKLCGLFEKAGLKNVTLKLYEGGRHEMLNETNKAEVFSDIFGWIESSMTPHG